MKKQINFLAAFLLFSACGSDQNAQKESVREGEAIISADESLKPLLDAQVNAYKANYPKTKFKIIYTPEQNAVSLLLNDSSTVCLVSRELDENEQQYFEKRKLKYQPATMAIDGLALIVNKNFPENSISVSEFKNILTGKDQSKTKVVFERSSCSNLKWTIDNILKGEEMDRTRIFAGEGTESVFDQVERNVNYIGVVGYNWISDEDDKASMNRKSRIKLLAVENEEGKPIELDLYSLSNLSYPFHKKVYLHTTQFRWGVSKGFVRFACSQIGQLVVEKFGLQPYYMMRKQYRMSETPELNIVE